MPLKLLNQEQGIKNLNNGVDTRMWTQVKGLEIWAKAALKLLKFSDQRSMNERVNTLLMLLPGAEGGPSPLAHLNLDPGHPDGEC